MQGSNPSPTQPPLPYDFEGIGLPPKPDNAPATPGFDLGALPNSLTGAQLAERLALLGDHLRTMDRDRSGNLSESEIRTSTRAERDFTAGMRAWDIAFQMQHDAARRLPGSTAQHQIAVPNAEFYNRATLVAELSGESRFSGLSRERIDAAITQVLPGGVATISLGTMCASRPDVGCMPLPNNKVMIMARNGRTT